jgi:hypothetical protein
MASVQTGAQKSFKVTGEGMRNKGDGNITPSPPIVNDVRHDVRHTPRIFI